MSVACVLENHSVKGSWEATESTEAQVGGVALPSLPLAQRHTGDMGLSLGAAATHTSVSSFLFLSSLLSFSPSFSACPPRTSWSRRCTSSSTLSTYCNDGHEGP